MLPNSEVERKLVPQLSKAICPFMRKGKEKFFRKELESYPSLHYTPFLMTKKKTQHYWGNG